MSVSRRLRRAIVSQFHRPRGPLGHLAGWILARRPSNRERNRWTVELLDIQPKDRVLELGCGPGVSIGWAALRARDGHVVGLDHSETMVAMARRRNRSAIREGRVSIVCGSFADLSRLDGPFDRIFAVNAFQFAEDPRRLLHALLGLLEPGGTLATTFQSRRPGATDADVRRAGEERARLFVESGLRDVRMELLPLRPVCAVCVLGNAPRSRA